MESWKEEKPVWLGEQGGRTVRKEIIEENRDSVIQRFGFSFLSHGKPLEIFKQETGMIQLMTENDDFGCGLAKNTLYRDGRESQQTS